MNEIKDDAKPDEVALKRCALALHALASRDRDWMLTKLPSVHRDGLEKLVRELQELGIPADSRVVQDAIVRGAASQKAPITPDVSEMAGLLEQEPPQLIAQALILHNALREQILAQLSASKRRQVQQLLAPAGAAASAAPLPAALSRALRDELAIRLRQRPNITLAPKNPLARRRWPAWTGLARFMQ